MASFIHSRVRVHTPFYVVLTWIERQIDGEKVSSQLLFRIVETTLALIVLFCEEKFIRLAANQNKNKTVSPHTHTHTLQYFLRGQIFAGRIWCDRQENFLLLHTSIEER